MSDMRSSGREPSLRQSLGLDRHPFTPVKYLAFGGAILMMILGVVVALATDRPPSSTPSVSHAPPDISYPEVGFPGHGFAPTRPSASGVEPLPDSKDDSLGVHDLSPFLVKGGFGLFIGFAIGFAMRAFFRLAVVIMGFYLLVLSMMAYVGWVEIHWNLMENQFTHLVSFLGGQFESFKTFLTGAIPASSLALAGFAIGLRRR